jgi:hypothetical protein
MDFYNYDYSYQASPGVTLLSFAVAILGIVAMWKIFEKAGEPGWAAIIPFYNLYVLFKITWGSGWKFLLLLIPFANIVIAITMVKLAKAFGKSGGFAVGLIFLSVIFYCILAFDQSQYQGVPEKA